MVETLREKNQIPVFSVDSPEFASYGRVLTGYPTQELVTYLEEKTPVPESGNIYVASDPEMEALPGAQAFSRDLYGEMPIEIGYCNGNNSRLNCLEYHKSSEVDIAATPQVLLLAHLWEIVDNAIDSSKAAAFYLPKGTAVELFATTLHFSPCKVTEAGFKTVIILPKGTNFPLEQPPRQRGAEEKLLWMTNKWLIACPGTHQAEKGAWAGITGENFSLKF